MRLLTTFVVLVLGLWAGVLPAEPAEGGSQAANTGGYRGPDGDGVYPARALLKEWPKEGPKLLWSANCGDGYAGPTVADGIAYFPGGVQGVLYAYTLDGKLLNRLPFGSCAWKRWSGTRSTPIVRDGVAVCTTPNSSVVGLDLKTGEQRWSVNAWKSFGSGKGTMGWGYPESPVNIGNKIIINCCSRDDESPPFVALDIKTGKPVWEAKPGPGKMAYSGADCASAAFRHHGRNYFFGQGWRRLGLYDGDTGELIWDLAAANERTGKPAYWNGFLWFDAGGGKMEMVKLSDDAKTYTPLWSRGGISYAQYAMLGGRIYMPGSATNSKDERPLGPDGKPVLAFPDPPLPGGKAPAGNGTVCIDIPTGKALSVVPRQGGHGHIIAADGMVYSLEDVAENCFRLRLIKPLADGGMQVTGDFTYTIPPREQAGIKQGDELLFSTSACPVIAEGRLFLKYGRFYVFDLRAEQTSDGHRRDGMGQAVNAKPPIKWWRERNVQWTADLPGQGRASPVTNGEKVFVACDGGVLACLDAATGGVQWKQTLTVPAAKGEAPAVCTPIVRENHLYVAFGNGAVGCYDLAGKLVWSGLLDPAADATPLSAPVLSEKVVIFQGQRLAALEAGTGQPVWTMEVPAGAAVGTPAKYRLDDTNLLVTSWGDLVRAVDGKVLWKPAAQLSGVTAVVADGVLFLRGRRDGQGLVQALKLPANAAEGMKLEQVWEQPVTPEDCGALVVADGILYMLESSGVLTAYQAPTGGKLYAAPVLANRGLPRQADRVGLVAAGGMLCATLNDETVVVKPGKVFEQLWKYEVRDGAAEAAYAADKQFLRGGAKLYGIGGETPAAPVELEITALKATVVPAGAPLSPLVSDTCPASWVVAGPFKGRDLTKEYLAALGGRAAAVPKPGDEAKLGAEVQAFRALPNNAWWTDGGRFTNDMKSITIANGDPAGPAAAPKALNSTLIFSTVIQNDAARYVRFRSLTPDGISWNYKQRLDSQGWLAGKALDEKTVYKLEKGDYPLLLQTATGDMEGWGKIWMCPRLVDCTPEIERKLADYAKVKAGWEAYQSSLKTTFVLQP